MDGEIVLTDRILEAVLGKMEAKYNAGVIEHGGKGLWDANLSLLEYLRMLQEEQLDQLNYIEGAIQTLEKLANDG